LSRKNLARLNNKNQRGKQIVLKASQAGASNYDAYEMLKPQSITLEEYGTSEHLQRQKKKSEVYSQASALSIRKNSATNLELRSLYSGRGSLRS